MAQILATPAAIAASSPSINSVGVAKVHRITPTASMQTTTRESDRTFFLTIWIKSVGLTNPRFSFYHKGFLRLLNPIVPFGSETSLNRLRIKSRDLTVYRNQRAIRVTDLQLIYK